MFDKPKKKEPPAPHNTHASDYTSLLQDFPQLKGMIDALAKKDQEAREHKPIKDDIMFDNIKNLLERGGNSGLYNRDGTLAVAADSSDPRLDEPKQGKDVTLQKPEQGGGHKTMASKIAADKASEGQPPEGVGKRPQYIYDTKGKKIGAVGSKVRINSATEIVVKNIMQEIAPVEEMMTGNIASFPTPMGSPSVVPTPMVAPQMQPKLCPCGSGKPASECCQQQTIKVHDAINTTMRNAPVDRGSRLRRITNVLGGL